jgi:hypothetical protein
LKGGCFLPVAELREKVDWGRIGSENSMKKYTMDFIDKKHK